MYRFKRYSGTGSSDMMVPIQALRWYRLKRYSGTVSPILSVVALISKSGKISYWDLNDLPINTRQYENSIDNDILTAIYTVADEPYRNENQLNCNLNMKKKLIRLTKSAKTADIPVFGWVDIDRFFAMFPDNILE